MTRFWTNRPEFTWNVLNFNKEFEKFAFESNRGCLIFHGAYRGGAYKNQASPGYQIDAKFFETERGVSFHNNISNINNQSF